MDDKLLDTIFTILMREFATGKQDGEKILDVSLEICKEAALYYIIPIVEARVKEAREKDNEKIEKTTRNYP